MNPYNPYAAPSAERMGPDAGLPPLGAPQPWSATDAISQAWSIYKIHWATLTVGYFVLLILGGMPGQIPNVLVQVGAFNASSGGYYAVLIGTQLIGWIITSFLSAGFIRAALKTVRGETPSFGDFFSGPSFLNYLATSFLTTVVVVVGVLCLIVPGVIASLGLFNAPFYCIDRKMGPIEAMKASWESTDGQKGDVFVFYLLQVVISLVGVAACCVGLFAVGPIVMLAHAIVYMKMSGAGAPPPPAQGGFGGGYPPPGGYGPPGGGYGGPPSHGGPPAGGFGGGPPGY